MFGRPVMPHSLLALALAVYAHAAPGKSPLQLRPLMYQSRGDDSTACAFRLTSSSEFRTDVFKWAMGDVAWLNVGGDDVSIQVVKEQDFPLRKHEITIGDRSLREFKGAGLRAVLDTRVTRVCPRDNPYCEIWYEAGTLSVTKGSASVKVQVKGACTAG